MANSQIAVAVNGSSGAQGVPAIRKGPRVSISSIPSGTVLFQCMFQVMDAQILSHCPRERKWIEHAWLQSLSSSRASCGLSQIEVVDYEHLIPELIQRVKVFSKQWSKPLKSTKIVTLQL